MTRKLVNRFYQARDWVQLLAGFSIFALVGILPIILPLIRRAAPVLLALSGLIAVLVLFGKNKSDIVSRYAADVPLAGALILFFGLALSSVIWSPVPNRALLAVLSIASLLVAMRLTLAALNMMEFRLPAYFPWCIALGSCLIVFDHVMGGVLLKLIHSRPEPYRYNMVVVSLIALFCAVLHPRFSIVPKLVCLAALSSAVYVSESETAKVGLLLVLVVYLVAYFLPQKIAIALGFCALLSIWVGLPWTDEIAGRISSLIPHVKAEGHVAERLQIWSGFLQMAQAGLPWGWGVESVSASRETSFFQGASSDVQAAITYMHPHNFPIQVAVELGWGGIFLAFWLSMLLLVNVARASAADLPPLMTLFGYAYFVGLVSHGFWQAWWWAAIFCAIIAVNAVSHSTEHA